ncbi:MAG: DUF2938 domain-containing protein [Achromobacter sp.]|jgi:hypothetical protein|uniref:DUF2938 domain-containing protein n=2 Tax=Pseudomonadota TaxID=1224 RepID=A0A6J4ZJ78_9BURK|nr:MULTISPECIES: DUF2938 domain-containing protein [Achromobacter]MBN9639141.1 DUF2938 domain-containing protein [Achromobacter sp.]CAB3632734.1 hypothetical protein LMG26845_00923 [Achromobacter insuavis]CAB3831780.1 hypothetical protein LMG26846_01006 [Achromobacter insuavis]CUI34167.1 Protein of uncharacterised function (DUF2938) [Achromobacter sp. 2789STDY5608628]CUI52843.1 Protein of uncharacterised function (DUF2938) [Achromobacter sp. 2789STDY5608633]
MPSDLLLRAVLIGVGATLVMDLWALLLKRLFNAPSLDYAMVGRWIGHLPRGRLTHPGIARSAPIAGERAIGWIAHYAIGVLFALLLLALWGPAWAARPTLLPALIVGIATVAAPFLILQPGMGAGIAASRMPKPGVARLRSLMAHASFGVGLYLAGWLVAACLDA